MTGGVSMNGLGLGLELLAHIDVPLRARAAALRRQVEIHRENARQIARTPTGATPELAALLASLEGEAAVMQRAAADFERRAAEQEEKGEPAPAGDIPRFAYVVVDQPAEGPRRGDRVIVVSEGDGCVNVVSPTRNAWRMPRDAVGPDIDPLVPTGAGKP